MNICFIANYDKTIFFSEISNILLEKNNINIYWIVVNKSNYEYLNKITPNILYLPESEIVKKENPIIDNFKLNELVACDRVLKFKKETGIKYLSSIQKPIYEFIKKNEIKYVFGELTWAHELLIFRILKYKEELECKFLNPHTIRIPGGRFAFFEDEFQSKICKIKKLREEFKEELFIPKKPDYLKLNDALLKQKGSLRGITKRFIKIFTSKYFDKDDITLLSRFNTQRILLPLKIEIYKRLYRWFIPRCNTEYLKNKKFILLTLHKQPEASIDVLGRYVENQYDNIVNIWKQLPEDYYLVVKEHSNAIGDRDLSFYKELQKYKNLLFVNENTDSYTLLNICQAVVTVSGTIAYEAALLNKKALVMCDVFFKLSNIKKITTEDFRHTKNILEILEQMPIQNITDSEVKDFIFNNSFEGIISDPISNPKCMEVSNIEKVSSAINLIINL